MSSKDNTYDVAIVGAGISGTALLYCLSNYTNIDRIVLIEKESEVALINSHKYSNSQTLHFGDIETNYTLAKATKVNRASCLVKNYLLNNDRQQQIYSKYHKMVVAVGKEQVEKLKARAQEFKNLFPDLKIIERQEIEKLEPNVIKGRKDSEEILALFTPEGYTIDFQKLARSFLEKSLDWAQPTLRDCNNKILDLMMNSKVKKIIKIGDIYQVYTDTKVISARTVAITAGAHSLLLAKSLGYGQEYALLCVAGSFYFAPEILNGKVYTMQLEKLPFAAIHGDPEVDDRSNIRFGPTAKVLPMLERHRYRTIYEYFQTAGLSLAALRSFFKILSDSFLFKYIVKNLLYDVPVIGKRMFIEEVKKIVPSIQLNELKFAKGYGGVRPQIVNLKTQSLEMGEAKILGDKIIFNITPSTGASTCLQNAEDDTMKIINFLGDKYYFDRDRFLQDLENKKQMNV
ncbi:MAG: FAD-dependent oxidoreductase [Xenococcaceae cyanobacterium]